MRGDPLVPVLGSAVAAVVTGAVLFVFYPRVERFVRGDGAVVDAAPPSGSAPVPVWVCRSVEGVALLLEPFSDASSEAILNGGLRGAPHHLLRLVVCNFAGPQVFTLELAPGELRSPEGASAGTPAAELVKEGSSPELLAVLRGLGAVSRLDVARGHQGQALLAVFQNPANRASFVTKGLTFERREVKRQLLASWRNHPDWKRFKDF